MAFYFGVAALLATVKLFRLPFAMMGGIAAFGVLALSLMIPERPYLAFASYFCAGGGFYFALRGNIAAAGITLASIALCVAQLATKPPLTIFLFLVLTVVCAYLATTYAASICMDRQLGDLSYPLYVGHWLPLLILPYIATSYPIVGPALATLSAFVLMAVYFFTGELPSRGLRARVRGTAIR